MSTLSDYVRPATFADAETLAPKLREADKRELMAAVGVEPLAALTLSVAVSEVCYTLVTPSGDPCALLGVAPTAPLAGAIWMMGTDDLVRYSKILLRYSREGTELLNQKYPVLYNFVDARNTVHIRWIAWCGFTFIKRHEKHGAAQVPFLEFVRIPTNV